MSRRRASFSSSSSGDDSSLAPTVAIQRTLSPNVAPDSITEEDRIYVSDFRDTTSISSPVASDTFHVPPNGSRSLSVPPIDVLSELSPRNVGHDLSLSLPFHDDSSSRQDTPNVVNFEGKVSHTFIPLIFSYRIEGSKAEPECIPDSLSSSQNDESSSELEYVEYSHSLSRPDQENLRISG